MPSSRTPLAPRSGAVTALAASLGATAQLALTALVAYPLAPPEYWADLLRRDDHDSLDRMFRRLADRGLARAARIPGPGGGHPRPHWFLSDQGLAVAATLLGQGPRELARTWRLRGGDLHRALRRWEVTTGLYDAALIFAAAVPGRPIVRAWRRPWLVPWYTHPDRHQRADGRERVVAFPAALALTSVLADGTRVVAECALLPDIPGVPVAHWRGQCAALAEYHHGWWPSSAEASAPRRRRTPLLIAASTAARAREWAALWNDLLRPFGLASWQESPAVDIAFPYGHLAEPDGTGGSGSSRWHPALFPSTPRADRPRAAERGPFAVEVAAGQTVPPGEIDAGGAHLIDAPLERRIYRVGVPAALALPHEGWSLLARIAALPFAHEAILASALSWSVHRVRRHRRIMLEAGLARRLRAGDHPVAGRRYAGTDLTGSPVEATRAGLRALAEARGLALGTLIADQGYAGGGPQDPLGNRTELARALVHTRSIHTVYQRFLFAAARAKPAESTSGEGLDWWNTAQSGVGPFRPDAAGVVRLSGEPYPFYLEYDRATEGWGQYARKLLRYQRFADARPSGHRPDPFPPILVVTERNGTEELIAEVARALKARSLLALPIWLTTVERLARDPATGPLAPIWRTPADPARHCWWH